jgi:hypothetical protein
MKSMPLLRDVTPELAAELVTQLERQSEAAPARQVGTLRVLDHAASGKAVAIYTAPAPDAAYGPTHRNVHFDVRKGMVILDVVGERIACVEVLGRGDVRARLRGPED